MFGFQARHIKEKTIVVDSSPGCVQPNEDAHGGRTAGTSIFSYGLHCGVGHQENGRRPIGAWQAARDRVRMNQQRRGRTGYAWFETTTSYGRTDAFQFTSTKGSDRSLRAEHLDAALFGVPAGYVAETQNTQELYGMPSMS